MSLPDSMEVTGLLKAWGAGDRAALDRLTPRVYEELRRMSGRYMQRERDAHTMQPTALVNDLYLRLVDISSADWKDRAHFFAVCAQMMRRILVDSARARRASKRGGGAIRIDLEEAPVMAADRDASAVALDEALEELAKFDARKARVVELRFFGGLSVEETAAVLGISPQSVLRDWKLAKAWLTKQMQGGAHDQPRP